MEKKDIIELTKKVYKVTLFFPKKEPLRHKLREMADEIMADSAILENQKNFNPEKINFSLENNLEIIDRYFEVAKWQNWVSYFDILEVQEEYGKIKENLIRDFAGAEVQANPSLSFIAKKAEPDEIIEKTEIVSIAEQNDELKLDARKEKIIEILGKVGRIQVGEINKFFPDISKRTIRRDFHKLVELRILERKGERNNTFYKIKMQDFR